MDLFLINAYFKIGETILKKTGKVFCPTSFSLVNMRQEFYKRLLEQEALPFTDNVSQYKITKNLEISSSIVHLLYYIYYST